MLHLPGGIDLPVPAARVALCAQHAGRTVTFGLRPEHIFAGSASNPTWAHMSGRVILLEPLGSDTLGLVKLGAGDEAAEITGRFPPDAAMRVGENLQVSLALDRFHLFDADTGAAIRGAGW